MSFINKVVLVTGAGSGIGETISYHFAKYAARLSLADKDANNLMKTAEECERLSKAKVLTTVADLRNDQDVLKVVQNTKNHYGRIDVVINCAGVYKPASILDPKLIEVFDDVMTTNLRSIVYLTNCVARELEETKGNIINISSAAFSLGGSRSVPYETSIAALDHFTTCVALDLAAKGIRVNSISPGVVKTNILDNAGVDKEKSEAFWNGATSAPLSRLVKTEDVAEFVVFLASDKAKAMTGCNYPIDAGLAIRAPGFSFE